MASKLNLLHIAPYIAENPIYGGIPSAVKSICLALLQTGHRVVIWASDLGNASSSPQREMQPDIEIHLFKARWRPVGATLNAPIVPELMLLNGNALRDFDMVHLHGYWLTFAPTIARVCKRSGTPLVLQPHGSLVHSGQKELAKQVFQWLFRREIIRATSLVVASSQDEQYQLEGNGFPQSLIRIVPNPITYSSMPLLSSREAREYLAFPTDHKIILYLGRLHPAKGLRELLLAYRIVKEAIPQSILVLAGPDEGMQSKLVHLARSLKLGGVKFLGPLCTEEKWVALRAADVFCLPSSFEAFPMSILEAAVAGVPIVLSKRVNLPAFREGAALLSVEPSAEPLADCLVNVLCDRSLRDKMARNASLCARRFFSPDVVAARLEEVYDAALVAP